MAVDTAAGSATRDRLLAAARDEFAAHGIAGARVDRIARVAGANKERIYGYFGSKENLFQAVIAAAKAEHTAALGEPSGDLAEYVGRLYDHHREHPTLLRLMQWEALYYGDQRPAEDNGRADLYRDKVAALANAMGGSTHRDAAATLLILIGLAAWPHTAPQLRRFLVDTDDEEATHQAVRQHVVEFARAALYR
ncbi:MAG TPA: TetR family transcriptional regulator [Jiangellaceae bacterium]|nr:TetR family transcriptional regulator [Jiangellaceae bacterium]